MPDSKDGAEERIKLKLDRRSPKRRRVLIVLPPMPIGGRLEIIQGESRTADDVLFAPKGTRIVRP